ncbi:glucosamine-6-phosphate deaminase [Pullulanibacillus pueri]|uniref:Glucosamine-6-phosphate deaminase n=1 Tax=Pullulanibacillus pueri TaxID=1437324 RepID=A0A8J2ZZB4_9BACL|nr:glucosamine-6-phosphate deaminase [Pullulanibacillus pueri]MBM7683333.1 glucosamine-6-phosphate deaminase [Pullulanibacillus pueri]GGH86367.1 glucosamine-6-phosphate deaminase [Pullulanibacillus pueri]
MDRQLVKSMTVDQLKIKTFADRDSMGVAAALHTARLLSELMEKQDQVRMVFAAAPSQNEFLAHLVQLEHINWQRITAFHMDEYIGLPENHPARFSHYLNEHLFHKVPFGDIHYLNSDGDKAAACERYGQLIQAAPIDIVCLGIGENGHIAFNDPGVADFNDPEVVKTVLLDEACRWQQVHDGCFPDLASVPTEAITLTVPTLSSAKSMVCIVPGETKRQAVYETLNGPISEACPASILRRHPQASLFVDQKAYGVD